LLSSVNQCKAISNQYVYVRILINEINANIIDECLTQLAFTDCIITDSELAAHREKTGRHLRLRELLLENSKDSNLVVM
jgi:hypothetical protein